MEEPDFANPFDLLGWLPALLVPAVVLSCFYFIHQASERAEDELMDALYVKAAETVPVGTVIPVNSTSLKHVRKTWVPEGTNIFCYQQNGFQKLLERFPDGRIRVRVEGRSSPSDICPSSGHYTLKDGRERVVQFGKAITAMGSRYDALTAEFAASEQD